MQKLLKTSRPSEASSSATVGHAVSQGNNPQEQPRQHNQHPSSPNLPQPPSFIRPGSRPFTAGSDDVYSSNYRQPSSNYKPTNNFSPGPPNSPNSNSAGFRYSEVTLNSGSSSRVQGGIRYPALQKPGPPYVSVNSLNQRRHENANNIRRQTSQQTLSIPTNQKSNSPPGRIRIRMPPGQSLRIRL